MPQTVNTSLSSIATDPLRNFKFLVNITPVNSITGTNGKSITSLGFMSVSGLNLSTEVIPYRQGGMNTTPQKMPGQTDFSPLTLSRGVLLGTDQSWLWTKELFATLQGSAGTTGPGNDFRGHADILVLDHPVTKGGANTPVKMWFRCYNVWISNLGYSDLDAGGNGFMVEQMTLQHEGFELAWASSTPGASDAAAPALP